MGKGNRGFKPQGMANPLLMARLTKPVHEGPTIKERLEREWRPSWDDVRNVVHKKETTSTEFLEQWENQVYTNELEALREARRAKQERKQLRELARKKRETRRSLSNSSLSSLSSSASDHRRRRELRSRSRSRSTKRKRHRSNSKREKESKKNKNPADEQLFNHPHKLSVLLNTSRAIQQSECAVVRQGRIFGLQVSEPDQKKTPIINQRPYPTDNNLKGRRSQRQMDRYQETVDEAIRDIPDDYLINRVPSELPTLTDHDVWPMCPEDFTLTFDGRCKLNVIKEPMLSCPYGAYRDRGHNCVQVDSIAPHLVCPAFFQPFLRGCIRRTRIRPLLSCPAGTELVDDACVGVGELPARPVCPPDFRLSAGGSGKPRCIIMNDTSASIACRDGAVPLTQVLLLSLEALLNVKGPQALHLLHRELKMSGASPVCISEHHKTPDNFCPAGFHLEASTRETANAQSTEKQAKSTESDTKGKKENERTQEKGRQESKIDGRRESKGDDKRNAKNKETQTRNKSHQEQTSPEEQLTQQSLPRVTVAGDRSPIMPTPEVNGEAFSAANDSVTISSNVTLESTTLIVEGKKILIRRLEAKGTKHTIGVNKKQCVRNRVLQRTSKSKRQLNSTVFIERESDYICDEKKNDNCSEASVVPVTETTNSTAMCARDYDVSCVKDSWLAEVKDMKNAEDESRTTDKKQDVKCAEFTCRTLRLSPGNWTCPEGFNLQEKCESCPVCKGIKEVTPFLRCPLESQTPDTLGQCSTLIMQPIAMRCPNGFRSGIQEPENKQAAFKARRKQKHQPAVLEDPLPGLCERVEYAEYQSLCPKGYEVDGTTKAKSLVCIAYKIVPPSFICEPGFVVESAPEPLCEKSLEAAPTLVSTDKDSDSANGGVRNVSVCTFSEGKNLSCAKQRRFYGDITNTGLKLGNKFQDRKNSL